VGAGGPQSLPVVAVVDLDHRAVDLVVQVVALGQEPVAVVDGGLDVGDPLDVVVDGHPEVGQAAVLGPPALPEVAGLEHREEKARERALGDDRGVLLADRPGGGVAGVGERVLAALDALAVVRLEGVLWHEHLATHREQLRGVLGGQSLGDRPDRPDVAGDVVALVAVAPGGGPLQAPVLVDGLDGDPVELRLADVGDLADGLADSAVELPDVLGVVALVDREHRGDVLDGLELVDRLPAHPPGRRVLGPDVERLL